MMGLRLTVAGRLGLGFGVFFVLLVGALALAVSRLDALNGTVDRMVREVWPKVAAANGMAGLMNANARATFTLLLGGDARTLRGQIEANKSAITLSLEAIERQTESEEGRALLATIKEKRRRYVASFTQAADLLVAGSQAEAARVMVDETTPALDALLSAVDGFVQFQGRQADAAAAWAGATFVNARQALGLFLVVAAVLACVAAAWIIRSITRPLGGEPETVVAALRRIAEGDLTADVVARPGDGDSLVAAMSLMQDKLRAIIADMGGGSERVSAAAQQLSSVARQVADSAGSQSEAAATMAAAVQEVTVSVGEVSGGAGETHAMTARMGTLSADGERVIGEALSEMQHIVDTVDEASRVIFAMGENATRISGVAQVIKDIAEQTNLLALNAAIEAARAGEQGRGFAVVADEVRKLAERTSLATTEIRAMIGGVQESTEQAVATMQRAVARVGQGVGFAEQAGRTMVDINGGLGQVVASVSHMTAALREQSAATAQVATSVEHIAQMSEENSAAAREAADTAEELEKVAHLVRAAAGRFRLPVGAPAASC